MRAVFASTPRSAIGSQPPARGITSRRALAAAHADRAHVLVTGWSRPCRAPPSSNRASAETAVAGQDGVRRSIERAVWYLNDQRDRAVGLLAPGFVPPPV